MPSPRVHHFHAEATALHANLQHPLNGEIKPQNHLKLNQEGGYLSDHVKDYRVDNVVSFKTAHTHVAGHESPKRDHPWITLTTSSIEQLNVLEVVTADRVVSQIATEHPRPDGLHVPKVTFLGTRFENLRVGGYQVNVEFNSKLFYLQPPAGDLPYIGDSGFLKEIGSSDSFPDLKREWGEYLKQLAAGGGTRPGAKARGTLVEKLSAGPFQTSGNRIKVPEFGEIVVAELEVDCDTFHLTMLRLDMGCLAAGTMMLSSTITNGSTRP